MTFSYKCRKCGLEMRVTEEVFLSRIKSCPRCGFSPQAEETVALSPDVVLTTSAANMAGGTVSIKRALELMTGLSKEQLESLGLTLLPEKIDGVYKQLEIMQEDYRSYFGRSERAVGDLLPKIVKEYYELEGYTAREVDESIDKSFKIDLIAEKGNVTRAIQVKKGTVSSQEIHEICKKARSYLEQRVPNQKIKIIEVVAKNFPYDYLEIRDAFMKTQKEITLNYVHFYQIAQKMQVSLPYL